VKVRLLAYMAGCLLQIPHRLWKDGCQQHWWEWESDEDYLPVGEVENDDLPDEI
jgi:hypothetical protein